MRVYVYFYCTTVVGIILLKETGSRGLNSIGDTYVQPLENCNLCIPKNGKSLPTVLLLLYNVLCMIPLKTRARMA